MRGGLKWLVAGAIAVALHAALLMGSEGRLHGNASPPAGPLLESAASLAGIVGSEAEIESETPPEESQLERESEVTEAAVQEKTVVAVTAPLVIPETRSDAAKVPAVEVISEAPTSELALDTNEQPRRTETTPRSTSDAPKKEPPQKSEATKPKAASQRGNATQGKAGTSGGGGTATASAGAVSAYAAQIRARILARSPTGSGTQGTTVIRFGVALDGGLRFASVLRSSGNAALDDRALAAVRGTSFPSPPKGATVSQLTFSIPFHFR